MSTLSDGDGHGRATVISAFGRCRMMYALYFACHARSVERLMEWFQHTSMTGVPAAASRRMLWIRASE
jgi:hypothetical protein